MLAMMLAASVAPGWNLVWSEEFDVDGAPNPEIWRYEDGVIRNQELQHYTVQDMDNVRVEDGKLVIEALFEETPNPLYDPSSEGWQAEREFSTVTSGSVTTEGTVEFLYGRIEVSAKVPPGKGTWPAIWMLGVNFREIGWPKCGEIDIMEYVGKEPNTIHGTMHWSDPDRMDVAWMGHTGRGDRIEVEAPYSRFHVYAIEWDENEIVWFMDDTEYHRMDLSEMDDAPEGNPFRKPHYLLINLAIGGGWGGELDPEAMPARYEIDYVRYYTRD